MNFQVQDRSEYWSSAIGKKTLENFRSIGLESGFLPEASTFMADPFAFRRVELAELSGELTRIYFAFSSLARRTFDTPSSLFQFCGANKEQIPVLEQLSALPSAWSRPLRWDIILSQEGAKAIEVNHGWMLGGINMSQMQSGYDCMHIPGMDRDWTYPLHAFILHLQKSMKEERKTKIIICDDDHYFNTYTDFIGYLVRLAEKNGIAAEAIPMSQWAGEHSKGDKLVEIFSALELAAYENKILDRYIDTLLVRHERPFTSPYDVIWSSKAMFALAWQGVENGWLDLETAHLVQKLIPHTQILTEAIRSFALREQGRLLIKPVFGMCGSGFMAGAFVDPNIWERAVDDALGGSIPFLLQEYIKPQSSIVHLQRPNGFVEQGEHPFVLGLFQVNEVFAGGMMRAGISLNGNINGCMGAGMGIIREQL